MTADGGDVAQDVPARSAKTRLRAIVTSVPGFMTGLAAVVTAVAAILGVFSGGGSNNQAATGGGVGAATGGTATNSTATNSTAPSAASSGGGPAASASSPAADAAAAAPRVQWGPGTLVITNGVTDFSSVPPVSSAGSGDLYDSGDSGVSAMADTREALWTGTATPTARQCSDLVTTQSSGTTVTVHPGSILCAQTDTGLVAVIEVKSVDDGADTVTTSTTVWIMPGG